MEKISVKLYKNISFEKWTFPMLVPQERTPAGSVARCSRSYCLWKYSSLHSLHMAFCPELGHLQKGVSLGFQQVTWCQVVAPPLWLFCCHWPHRWHGGGGGREAGSGVHPLLWSHGATEYEVSPSPLASCHDIQPIWHQEGAEESGSWLAELPL